jgi:glycine betaine/proline transport system permease protein
MSPEWLDEFPTLGRTALREMRRFIDDGFLGFTRAYGEAIENFFNPLKAFLIGSEKFLLTTPWPLVILGFAALAWFASRSWKITLGAVLTLAAVGVLGMWDDTMKTVSMIFVSTVVAIAIGLPVGILMSRSDRLRSLVSPALDVMQTMPSFVYLIPVVMLLGIGRVPGLLAVIIYAIAPIIRLTDLGVRLVDKDVLEAADAYGSSPWQKLWRVQLPLALPTIMAGINQTIMLALSMVVIASMIGVQGLGQPVLKAIANQYFAMGILNGMAIVGIAIVFDRVSQAYGRRLQSYKEPQHGH